jgi:metal-dependent hydrolase (beta-lactamase superfamily II)
MAYACCVQVDVFTSGIWQTTSTIVSRGDTCVVIDPAYFPRELEAIAARVGELGRAAAVVFTHGHWDHVIGHAALPGAEVWASEALREAVESKHPRAVREVVPGHGQRMPAREAAAIARADLAYLEGLLEAGERSDVAAARELALPRAADVVGMREHHRDNCAAVGLAL